MPTSGTEKVPGISEEAIRAASDRIATSPVKAVYEDADRIARVAVRAAYPAIRASVLEEVRERLLGEEAVEEIAKEMFWVDLPESNIYAAGGETAQMYRDLSRKCLTAAVDVALATVTPESETDHA